MISLTKNNFPLIPSGELFGQVPDASLPPNTMVGGWSASPQELSQGKVKLNGTQEFISMGVATSISSGIGIFFGSDNAATKGYDFRVGDPAGNYVQWDASAATLSISGALAASTIDIGGADATSFHVDIDGNMWLGAATYAAAPAKVSNAGAATFSNVTVTGGAITGTPIASIPNNSSTDISLMECSHNLVFSVTDANTIAWASGTIVFSNGRTFTIDAGNTGNMAALTYIYLDPGTSTTVLQTTTTYSTAMGGNKRLIGTAQNNTVTANFIPYGGGQVLVDGAQIGALSIVAGNIAASTITADKMSVSQLSAIAADIGSITAGSMAGVTMSIGSGNSIFKADANGIYLGNATFASAPFRVSMAGALTATSATISGAITATSGQIGGWTVNSTSIYTGTEDHSGYTANSGDITIYSDGADASFHMFNTYIDTTGKLFTKSATIGGWTIDSTSIYTGTEDHSGYTANAGDITLYSNGTDASIHAKNWYIDTSGVLNATGVVVDGALTAGTSSNISVQYLTAGTISSKSIVLAVTGGTGDVEVRSGIATGDFANAGAANGFIFGLDDSDSDKVKFYWGNSTNHVRYDGTNLYVNNSALSFYPFFGDGSDGAGTISSNTTLTSDKYYTDLTVDNGFTLNTGGFRIFCTGTLTNNGTISRVGSNGGDGNDGGTGISTGGAAGAALAAGTLPASLAGVAGGTSGGDGADGVIGVTGNNEANGIGSTGAAGGAGGNGAAFNGGGAGPGGTVTTSTTKPRDIVTASTLTIIGGTTRVNGAAGGGGGGGGGGGAGGSGAWGGSGGGSASNGGAVIIAAKTIVNAGTISVKGGTGGAGGDGENQGGSSGGGAGGGAGGSGGILILFYSSLSSSGTITVAGGTGGAGGVKGAVGSQDGSAGNTGTSGTRIDFIV